jgi:hypothetical protein
VFTIRGWTAARSGNDVFQTFNLIVTALGLPAFFVVKFSTYGFRPIAVQVAHALYITVSAHV